MSRYPSGQPVRLNTTVADVSGTLVNAGGLTLLVQKPDLTTQSYGSPVNESTGKYHQDVLPTDLSQVGHYQYTWTATGSGAGVSFGGFDVFNPLDVAVLSLQDAKAATNIPLATTTYDSELADMVASVQVNLERLIGGPIITRTITEHVVPSRGREVLILQQRPLVSITSIVDNYSGISIDVSDVDLDKPAGLVRRKLLLPFLVLGTTEVTYKAGLGTTVPPAIALAARIIVQHLWETQRGPSQFPGSGGDELATTLSGFAIPNRALEVLSPYLLEAYI